MTSTILCQRSSNTKIVQRREKERTKEREKERKKERKKEREGESKIEGGVRGLIWHKADLRVGSHRKVRTE